MSQILALAETTAHFPGEESAVATASIVLVGIALVYAAVAAWVATPSSRPEDH